MRWGDPLFLKLLPLVLPLAGLMIWAGWQTRRRAGRLVDPALWSRLAPVWPLWRRLAGGGLLILALIACLIGAARPQLGARQVQVKRSGIDVLFLLDTSVSMNAADVVPNRLARARREMIDLMEQLHGDRVGLVIFEGTAFRLCPLTLDYGAMRLYLDTVEGGMLPVPGSNVAAGLRAAIESFPKEGSRSKAVVLFSDGEARDPDMAGAIQAAREAGVRVWSVGVGTPGGEPIPERDEAGNMTGYKKDRSGQVVLSRLDEAALREIADGTGGSYHPATLAGGEVNDIHRGLEGLTEEEMAAGLRTQYEERFQFFAGLGVLCLIGLFVLPAGGRREEWRGRL